MEEFGENRHNDRWYAAGAGAHEILENTTVHNDLRYDVGRLWAAGDTQLPNIYFSSLVHFKFHKKRLVKNGDLREKHSRTIMEIINKKYVIEGMDAHIVENKSNKEWYPTPHLFVNPNQPGTVHRVLNGAAKLHCVSLNKSLLSGPDLLQNILNYVHLHFRQRPHDVSAEIEGMILQFGVLLSDQQSLRFLWREDLTINVVVDQNTRLIFGFIDSPSSANYALQRTVRYNDKFYPKDTTAVLENSYKDNYLDSGECPEKTINRSKVLAHLLLLGVFKLSKFVSNFSNLVDWIDASPQSSEPTVIVSCHEDSSRVLGINWDHTYDT